MLVSNQPLSTGPISALLSSAAPATSAPGWEVVPPLVTAARRIAIATAAFTLTAGIEAVFVPPAVQPVNLGFEVQPASAVKRSSLPGLQESTALRSVSVPFGWQEQPQAVRRKSGLQGAQESTALKSSTPLFGWQGQPQGVGTKRSFPVVGEGWPLDVAPPLIVASQWGFEAQPPVVVWRWQKTWVQEPLESWPYVVGDAPIATTPPKDSDAGWWDFDQRRERARASRQARADKDNRDIQEWLEDLDARLSVVNVEARSATLAAPHAARVAVVVVGSVSVNLMPAALSAPMAASGTVAQVHKVKPDRGFKAKIEAAIRSYRLSKAARAYRNSKRDET